MSPYRFFNPGEDCKWSCLDYMHIPKQTTVDKAWMLWSAWIPAAALSELHEVGKEFTKLHEKRNAKVHWLDKNHSDQRLLQPYRSQKEFTDWHVENSHWFAKNFQYIFLTIPNLATQSRGKWSFLCMVLFFPLCFPGYPAVTNTSSHLILVKLKKKSQILCHPFIFDFYYHSRKLLVRI